MKIMKFGGSSLTDADAIKQVASIVRNERQQGVDCILVLSAMAGITNTLIHAAETATEGSDAYEEYLADVREKHERAVTALFIDNKQQAVRNRLHTLFESLSHLLYGIKLVKECSDVSLACIAGFGEQCSCIILSAYLTELGMPAQYVDAREIIILSTTTEVVDVSITYPAIRNSMQDLQQIPVVTGFIASTDTGKATTLGRNGSDYTAALVGAAVSAEIVEIWTDVDGFFSADPRYVSNSFVLPELSMQEAMELANCGASVVHPYTLIPLMESVIPVRVRNTFNVSHKGTIILHGTVKHPYAITGLASIEKVAIINIEGNRMIGSRGIAGRIFTALSHAGVNIMMISQASSEHSICIVCRENDMPAALTGMHRELEHDIRSQRINYLTPVYDLELVAIVGANMRGQSGIAGKLFGALGKAGINILAIAQGSSEMNISFVVQGKDRACTLKTVHDTFFS